MPQTENKTPERKTYTHIKPVFITLKPGEKILGIFLGSSIGKFKSPQYRIKRDDGELVVLAGGRHQLDGLFEELNASEDFMGGLSGHKIEVSRGADVKLEGANSVATYEISHIFPCPQGCTGV